MNTAIKTMALTTGAALACLTASASPIQVDYASTSGSYIDFNGNSTFDFSPSLNSLRITSGTAAGLTGEITGAFTMGAITGFDAPVTGSGVLTINDGANLFTATVTWSDIFTYGTGSTLNTGGVVDLTNVHYTGSNSDLMNLAAQSDVNVVTFQFAPGMTLQQLETTASRTSFSGSIMAPAIPDGGLTVAMLGGTVLAFAGLRRKINA